MHLMHGNHSRDKATFCFFWPQTKTSLENAAIGPHSLALSPLPLFSQLAPTVQLIGFAVTVP